MLALASRSAESDSVPGVKRAWLWWRTSPIGCRFSTGGRLVPLQRLLYNSKTGWGQSVTYFTLPPCLPRKKTYFCFSTSFAESNKLPRTAPSWPCSLALFRFSTRVFCFVSVMLFLLFLRTAQPLSVCHKRFIRSNLIFPF